MLSRISLAMTQITLCGYFLSNILYYLSHMRIKTFALELFCFTDNRKLLHVEISWQNILTSPGQKRMKSHSLTIIQ